MKHFTKLAVAAALGTVLGTAAVAQELWATASRRWRTARSSSGRSTCLPVTGMRLT